MSFDLNEEKLELINLVCASLFAEPRFSKEDDPRAVLMETLVLKVASKDPEFILKVALYVRDDLNIRSTANFLLALAANIPECGPFYKKYFLKAVRLPSDWLDVAVLYQNLPDKKLKGRALPTSLRKAMSVSFAKFDAYQLAKYNKQNSLKRKRNKAKKLAEKMKAEGKPAPPIPQKKLTMKQMIRQLHISQPVPHVMCILGKKYPGDLISFRDSGLNGDFDPERAGKRMKLPIPETWETMISSKGNKAHVWEELIDNRKLPFMAMLRNLRNLLLAGISNRHHRWVKSRLTDERTVANSRQFPFSFFTAYEAIDIDLEALKQEIEDSKNNVEKVKKEGDPIRRKKKVVIPVNMPTPALIQQYREALDVAVKYATVNNVKPIRGSTVVLCSVSDSMCSSTLGRAVGRVKSLVEVGILLGLMCKYMCEECEFFIVAGNSRDGEPRLVSVKLKEGTILQNMETVIKNSNSLDGDFSFPVQYFEQFIQERKKIDNILVLNDNSLDPLHNPKIRGVLTKIRQEINPDLLYVSVDLNGRPQFVNRDESLHPHPNDILLSGFSDAILKFVAERGDGNQLEYIQHIDQVKKLDELSQKFNRRLNRFKFESATSSFWSFVDNVQTCKWDGCSVKVKKESLSAHMSECEFRIVSCEQEGCKEVFPFNQTEIHNNTQCLFRTVDKGEARKWRNVRIFVSSTFLDMHGERDILARYVFPEIKEFCAKKKVNFFYVDLRWGITEEDFRTGHLVDVCLGEVEKCKPFFLGILGDRYGWVLPTLPTNDPRFSWVSKYPGRSITELEILSGALLCKNMQLGSAMYLRSPSFTRQVPSEHHAAYICPPENREKLESLKERVKKECKRVSTYQANWSKEKKQATGLENFRDMVTKQLKEDIETMFPDNGEERDELSIEKDLHDKEVETKSRRFVGRKDILKDLFKYSDSKNSENHPFVIHGEPGYGKSSLAAKFSRSYQEQRPGAFVLSHFIGASPHSYDIRFLLWRICSELKKEYQVPEKVPDTYKELKQLLPRFLEHAAFGRPCIIVLDSINMLKLDKNNAHGLDWLPNTFPVKIIVTTYNNTPSHNALRYRNTEGMESHELVELKEDERKQLVSITLLEYRKKLEESPTNNQMRLITRKSGSSIPLWLTIACEELCLFGVYEEVSSEIKRLPAALPALLGYVLQRVEKDFGEPLVSRSLSLISCSRVGLTEEELLALLAPKGSTVIPQAKWSELQRGLQNFLRTVGYGKSATLNFVHKEMEAAVNKRYHRSKKRETESHKDLAEYFRLLADPEGNETWKGTSIRAFSELPFHLLHSQQQKEMETILTNFRFLSSKVNMGMIYELSSDLADANSNTEESFSMSLDDEEHDSPLDDSLRFINNNSYILAHYPKLMLQQAANQPDSTIVAQSAMEQWKKGDVSYPWIRWRNKPQDHDACQLTVAGQSEGMLSCDFSPDGKQMVCGSKDRSLKIFDVATGAQKITLSGHTNWVVDCQYSKDGSTIVSASWDGTVRLWDSYIGSEVKVFTGHNRRVSTCCFSNDSKMILSGSWDCTMKLWDPKSTNRYPVKDFRGHEKPISAVGFSPDDKFVVSASWDSTVRIWEVESGKCISILKGHTQSVRSVRFSPSGREIVSTSSDCTVRIWDIKREEEIWCLDGHSQPVNSCAFSEDGKHLISASDDQTIKVWDALGGTETNKIKIRDGSYGNGVSLSPDGKLAATANSDCTVRVWNVFSGGESFKLEGHTRSLTHVSFSPTGEFLASSSEDKTVKIWDTNNGQLLYTFDEHEDTVNHICFSPDGKRVVCASSDFTLLEFDIFSGDSVRYSGHSAPVMCCDYHPTKPQMISSSKDGTLRLWNTETQGVKKVWRGHMDWITKCAFSPDGKKLATVSWDFNAIIWDLRSGDAIHTLRGHTGALGGVGWDLDSKTLVTSSFDSTLKLWDVSDGVIITTMEGHSGRVNHCEWGKDGTIISCGDDGSIRLWDAAAGSEVLTFQGHSDNIRSVAISADKSQVISASDDCTVKVWDTKRNNVSDGHYDSVTDCCFSSDGKFLISVSQDGDANKMDFETNKITDTFYHPDEKVLTCCTSYKSDSYFFGTDSGEVWGQEHGRDIHIHDKFVSSIQTAGDYLITSSWDGTVAAFKPTGSIKYFRSHSDWVNWVSVNPAKESKILSASHDHKLYLWDHITNRTTLVGEHNNWVLSCDWDSTGVRAISSGYDSDIKLWDVNEGKSSVLHVSDSGKRVNRCFFMNDDKYIGAVSHDRDFKLIDTRTGKVETFFSLKGYGTSTCHWQNQIAIGDSLGNVYLTELMN